MPRHLRLAPEIPQCRVMDMGISVVCCTRTEIIAGNAAEWQPAQLGLWETYARDGRMIGREVVAYDVDFGNRPARLSLPRMSSRSVVWSRWRETQARVSSVCFHLNILAVGFLDAMAVLLDGNALCLALAGLQAEDPPRVKVHWRQLIPR